MTQDEVCRWKSSLVGANRQADTSSAENRRAPALGYSSLDPAGGARRPGPDVASKADIGGIKKRLALVCERVERAARACGRSPDEIRLVVVTKGRTSEEVDAVIEEGVSDIGENRVDALLERQRLLAKYPPGSVRLHLVGHLQRNKLSKAWAAMDVLHSLDSLALAEKIASRGGLKERSGYMGKPGGPAQIPFDILVQVNITREPQKYGFAPDAVLEALDKMIALGLEPKGFMCISRIGASTEEHRGYFEALAQLAQKARDASGRELPELSMGMTDDFEEAIKAGSTMVRVGRAIFEGA
jgi:PLP dependent protein